MTDEEVIERLESFEIHHGAVIAVLEYLKRKEHLRSPQLDPSVIIALKALADSVSAQERVTDREALLAGALRMMTAEVFRRGDVLNILHERLHERDAIIFNLLPKKPSFDV